MKEFPKASPKLFFFILALHGSCVITMGGFDGTLKEGFCSSIHSDPSNPYSCDVIRLKKYISEVIMYATLGNYATNQDYNVITKQVNCFVRGFCHDNIQGEDCNKCLIVARQLIEACAGYEGAQVTLVDCELRAEKYKFYDD